MASVRAEYRDLLFRKNILICDRHDSEKTLKIGLGDSQLPRDLAESEDYVGQTLLSLSKLLNIRITSGAELARPFMVEYASYMLGSKVPTAFYRGFPKSVLKLPIEKLLVDQLISYFVTYGMNDFSTSRHSIFETEEDMEQILAFRREWF